MPTLGLQDHEEETAKAAMTLLNCISSIQFCQQCAPPHFTNSPQSDAEFWSVCPIVAMEQSDNAGLR